MQKTSQLTFSNRGNALIGQEMFHILDRAKKLELEGHKIYHLELGEPKHYPPGRIINQTIISLLNMQVGYASSSGLHLFREKLAEYFTSKVESEIGFENVIISTANLLISQFLDIVCNQGDTVSFFYPAFPTYIASSQYLNLDIQAIDLDIANNFDLTKNDIDIVFKTSPPKVLIINSANNPTGKVYDKAALIYLIEQAKKHDCWILSDETYSTLCFDKEYYSLLNQLDNYNKLVVISSFSKTFSIPGYRIGYLVGDQQVCNKISLSTSTLTSCLPIFTQEGAMEGISIIDEFSEKMKKYYRTLVNECISLIETSKIISCNRPESAFYLLIDIKQTGLTDVGFCTKLLNESYTAATPGVSFGYQGIIRISICGEKDDVIEGIKQLVKFSDTVYKNK